MYDAQRVCGRQSRGHLHSEPGGPLHLHRATALDDPRQVLGKVLKGYEVATVVLAHLEDFDDVRVVDGGRERCLSAEALNVAAVSGEAWVEHFQRQDPATVRIESAVDDSLTAGGDLLQNLVSPYPPLHLHLHYLGALESVTVQTADICVPSGLIILSAVVPFLSATPSRPDRSLKGMGVSASTIFCRGRPPAVVLPKFTREAKAVGGAREERFYISPRATG